MPNYLYDFTTSSKSDWKIVNDVVMGGLSQGYFETNQDGHGVFTGEVSLENNGGFTSVRKDSEFPAIKDKSTLVLKIKGDGKRYQFRLKKDESDRHSYIQYFETSGEWEEIQLPLKDFEPWFRGRKLDMPNFNANQIEQIAFLIANKKEQSFRLEIDYIALK